MAGLLAPPNPIGRFCRDDFLCSIAALEMAYADDDLEISEIYTEPPDVSCLTDEDSGDEEGDLDRISGRLLHAPVEIRLRNNDQKVVKLSTSNQIQYFDGWNKYNSIKKMVVESVHVDGCDMSLKLNSLDPHLDYFPENLGYYSEE
ncbi:hypothetical protein NQ318_017605 [Aromia moschata]|uniref:Uncharacterized protein n=1 Tax=Aromia moschata TaxID=1265417 RepID=A0AAV8Z2P8_9CUCU|nr:hypothetical protein NQ318_017605 [Aromia moschata]